MKVHLAETIDRPPADVFRFVAEHHVENHPRWDPNMSLTQLTPGPMGVGTVIARRYLLDDAWVDGRMEVTEFHPDRSFAVVIRDGDAALRSRMTFEPEAGERTRVDLVLEADTPAARMDPAPISRTLARIKTMVESGAGPSDAINPELREAISAFDRAFAGGRLDEFLAYIADDARALLHEQPTLAGRNAIRASFADVFDRFDTSAYEPTYELIDVHDDSAYVLASFTEVLRPKDGQPGISVQGRAVQFWRREGDGRWRAFVLLTARSAPDQPAP